nr:MAG TPA: hypothetical protein [Caudoviricetes sp.]
MIVETVWIILQGLKCDRGRGGLNLYRAKA